ncbi:MAG: hypothetical protein ACYCSF_11690 [Acidimicrobiales bacterium]
MRSLWSVLALLIVGAMAAIGVGAGLTATVTELPGPVMVRAGKASIRPALDNQTARVTGLPLRAARHGERPERPEPVSIVAPKRAVLSLLPVGGDSSSSEQHSTGPSIAAATITSPTERARQTSDGKARSEPSDSSAALHR